MDNEIDLIQLISQLWQARRFILIIILVFVMSGVSVALVLPKQWTSYAVITEPENNQLIELRTTLAKLSVLGINISLGPKEVYNKYLKRLDSASLFQNYLQHSEFMKDKLGSDYYDENKLHYAVVTQSENFHIRQNDNNKKEPERIPYASWIVSFQSRTASEAQRVLDNYLQYVAANVNDDILNEIRSAVDLAVINHEDKLALDVVNLKNKYANDIKRLEYSLEIANSAGIKQPVYSNGQAVKDDPDYSVTLGADGIEKKLEIERGITDITEMNTDIQNRRYQLEQLKKIRVENMTFSSFHYQMPPSLPVKSDSPRKILIAMLAALSGLLVASGWVLLKSAMTGNQASGTAH